MFALMMGAVGSSQIGPIQRQNCVFAVNMDKLLSFIWQEQAAGSFCVGSIQAVCSHIFHGHVKFFLFSLHHNVCLSGFLSLSPGTLNNII